MDAGPLSKVRAAASSLFPSMRLLRDDEMVRLMLVGVLIGAVGGLAAGVFDYAIVQAGRLFLGTGEPSLNAPPLWASLVMPAAGGLLAGLVIRYGTREARPTGIPDVIASTLKSGTPLSLRDGLFSALGGAISVGAGQSGGREGPVAQLAASAASKICRRLRIAPSRARVLVAAGAAAGIAASFNTPVAAAFFALEIVLGNFAMQMFGPVVAATVTGTVMGQVLLGQRVALHAPPFGLESPAELPLYLVLGLVCAFVAVLFKRLVFRCGELLERARIPSWLRPGLAGLAVGAAAAAGLHQVMGNGYAYIEALIGGELELDMGLLAMVLVAKLVATALTTAGAGGAGVFAPSLFLGAVTGTAFGALVHTLWPGLTESPGAYGLVGMGAVAAAVARAPITMTLMLFEMTGNYQVILPLLLTLAVAGLVDARLDDSSIYLEVLRRRGIDPDRSREELVMYDLRVRDIFRERDHLAVDKGAAFRDLAALFMHHRVREVFVIDEAGRLDGLVDIQNVKGLLCEPHDELTVADVETRGVPTMSPDQPLADALPLFFRADTDELPVVAADGRLLGVLHERDVIGAYNREILRQDALLARIESGPSHERQVDFFELPPGCVMRPVEVDEGLAGASLAELGLPARFGVTVLAVITLDETGERRRFSASAHRRLERGDRLIAVGPEDSIKALVADPVAAGRVPPYEE
jgi:CIC family chloride channel protein